MIVNQNHLAVSGIPKSQHDVFQHSDGCFLMKNNRSVHSHMALGMYAVKKRRESDAYLWSMLQGIPSYSFGNRRYHKGIHSRRIHWPVVFRTSDRDQNNVVVLSDFILFLARSSLDIRACLAEFRRRRKTEFFQFLIYLFIGHVKYFFLHSADFVIGKTDIRARARFKSL